MKTGKIDHLHMNILNYFGTARDAHKCTHIHGVSLLKYSMLRAAYTQANICVEHKTNSCCAGISGNIKGEGRAVIDFPNNWHFKAKYYFVLMSVVLPSSNKTGPDLRPGLVFLKRVPTVLHLSMDVHMHYHSQSPS